MWGFNFLLPEMPVAGKGRYFDFWWLKNKDVFFSSQNSKHEGWQPKVVLSHSDMLESNLLSFSLFSPSVYSPLSRDTATARDVISSWKQIRKCGRPNGRPG